MTAVIIETLKLSVPEPLQEKVMDIYDSCRNQGNQGDLGAVSSFYGAEAFPQDNSRVVPVLIAKIMMQLWSPRMYRHVENLILDQALQEGYIEESQLQLIHVFDASGVDYHSGWVVDDRDDLMVDLVWNTFGMKQHFAQVQSHRLWLKTSYERLGAFLTQLPPEIVDRHDLSKFAFSQAIGYTLKWVHGIAHPLWHAACNLHLFSEPHHKQVWSHRQTPEDKQRKLETWLHAEDAFDPCPYGLHPEAHDYSNEDFPLPFLLESLVDMVAIEWERKIGGRLDVTNAELVTFDEKYLRRYNKKQYKIIKKVIEDVKSC